jgi:hypothetical protein
VAPNELVLTGAPGKAVSGTFIVTAAGGPVSFTVHSPNAKVIVSPAVWSLKSAGSWETVTVTVKSPIALNVRLTVDPGGLGVRVVFSIKA